MKVSLRKQETELVVRAALLGRGGKVTFSDTFITIEVEKWDEFLSIYWKACADITRHENWRLALRKRSVVIIMDSGKCWSSWVQMRMDENQRWGLWYGAAVEER